MVPGVTLPLDWAEAFAAKGATLVAGTGYQYGDTDFLEYSERLYALFARELRRGSGAVSVGEALARAKQQYLASTPELRPLHYKSVLISTVFGLPMLSIDMPGERIADDPATATVVPAAGRERHAGQPARPADASTSTSPTHSCPAPCGSPTSRAARSTRPTSKAPTASSRTRPSRRSRS